MVMSAVVNDGGGTDLSLICLGHRLSLVRTTIHSHVSRSSASRWASMDAPRDIRFEGGASIGLSAQVSAAPFASIFAPASASLPASD